LAAASPRSRVARFTSDPFSSVSRTSRCGVVDATLEQSGAEECATFYNQIRKGVLGVSQFDAVLRDADGEIHKPPNW
jgi:hypothetical protein